VTRDHEQHLLATVEVAVARASGGEADQALLQVLAAVGGVEGDSGGSRVALVANGLELVFVENVVDDRGNR
jgi:hypothetical protein